MSWKIFWSKLASFIFNFLRPKNKGGAELKQATNNQKSRSLFDFHIGPRYEITNITQQQYNQPVEKIPPSSINDTNTNVSGTAYKNNQNNR